MFPVPGQARLSTFYRLALAPLYPRLPPGFLPTLSSSIPLHKGLPSSHVVDAHPNGDRVLIGE